MNKIILPLVIIVLLIVGGGAYYYFVHMPRGEQASQTTPAETGTAADASQQQTASSTMTSMRELMMGASQTCTYTMPVEGGGTTGTVYVSNGKARSDFRITTEDGVVYDGSMISDENYVYTWSSLTNQGMKIAITPEMKEAGTTNPAGSTQDPNTPSNADLNQVLEYDCSPWITDLAKFVPPTTIAFSEMTLPSTSGAATGSGSAGGASTNPNLCSACANLDAESKASCLSALNCQ